MLGAAKDGNVKLFIVKVFILPIVICQRRSLWHASSSTAPHAFLGRHVKDGHVKDVAQGVAEGVAEGVPSEPGRRALSSPRHSPPPLPPPSLCSSR